MLEGIVDEVEGSVMKCREWSSEAAALTMGKQFMKDELRL